MKNEFKLLRVHGIDIKIGWSSLIVSTFISLFLAIGYFPTLVPGRGSFTYVRAALLSFTGLYASVLLHELAHAFIAQKQGLKVKSIVLSLLDEPTTFVEGQAEIRAQDAFWRAIVGPLTNLGLAGFFLAIANLSPHNSVVNVLAFYLMSLNFLLGAFNLIPAYPLDGGQLLHALVWGRTKNQLRATRVVTKVGSGFGWGCIGLGFFTVAGSAFFYGVLLMLFGMFLRNAARLTFIKSVVRPSLQGVKVAQVMRHDDRILNPQTSLALVTQAFVGFERGRRLPVVEQGYLLGTLSLEQLRHFSPSERDYMRVDKVMTQRGSLIALRPDDDLQSSIKILTLKSAPYAAVIGEGGQFVGLLYLSDIPRFLEKHQLLGSVESDVKLSKIGKEEFNKKS